MCGDDVHAELQKTSLRTHLLGCLLAPGGNFGLRRHQRDRNALGPKPLGDYAPHIIVIVVEDDGCGIPAELLDRIFDLFYTTRSAGEGTGLGLALSYQIINNHGGDITVDSAPGVGSRFHVRLPCS